MTPLHDNVLVQPIIEDEKNKAGIILTKDARKQNRAHVIKVGPKVKTIKPGDTILHYDNEGVEIDFRGDTLLMLNEGGDNRRGNIICVL